jgi:hypothetical protein
MQDGERVGRSARFLLPIEITHELGPMEINFEAGYCFARHNPGERLLGLAVGNEFAKRFEGLLEIYDDVTLGGSSRSKTVDIGGRYEFRKNMLVLFMAGRSIIGSGPLNGQPTFLGYAGLQLQLTRR